MTSSFGLDHSITREFDQECREDWPALSHGLRTCYQVGFAGVACGIAAARSIASSIWHAIRCLAATRAHCATTPWSSQAWRRPKSISAPRAVWCCSRWPISGRIFATARLSGRATHHTVRMAATHAIHKAREAVDFAYNAAGTTAIFENTIPWNAASATSTP